MHKTAIELQDFVKKQLRRGCPEGELINQLLQEGYTMEEVEKAIYSVPERSAADKPRLEPPFWYVFSVTFVILGAGLLFVKYLWLSSYAYFFIITGIAGIIAWQIIKAKAK
jgi:hypothetical protein